MRLSILSALAAALLATACSNPCDRLLKKVCACDGARAKKACSEAKAKRKAHDKANLDKKKCRAQLKDFSCSKI